MGLILRALPWWVWPLLGILVWGLHSNYKVVELEKERAEAKVEEQRLVNRDRTQRQTEARKVEEGYADKLKAAKANADSLRTAADGLRTQIYGNSSRDSAAICGVDGERGRALESLLAESAELARQGAEEVVRLGAKTASLQDHIKRVCVGTPNDNHKD